MTKKASCVVPQCRNSSEKTASVSAFYQKFPLKEKIRRRWIRSVQATFKSFTFVDSAIPTPRLCSDHFEDTNFIISKTGKRILKLDAVPTIFINNAPKKQPEVVVRPRHQSRRAASKEALKQMQILLEDEDDTVEIPDDDDVIPVPVVVSPPKKKYKLTHRKSSDGNDREVLVLKTITKTPNITNHYVENNLELECWVEELEPCQKERNKKLEEEEKALQSKLDELIKACKGEVVYKGDLTTVIEVSEHVQKTIQAVQASQKKPPIVLNSTVSSPQPGYQLVMDPRLGLIVGPVTPTSQTSHKQGKIQVATNLQAPVTPGTSGRSRASRGKKQQVPLVQPTPSPPIPATTRSVLNNKQINKRTAPQPPPAAPPATRSRGNESAALPVVVTPPVTRSRESAPLPVIVTPPITRSRENKIETLPVATPPVTRSRPGAITSNARPTESSVEGGLTTGTNLKPKAIVDLTTDDGRPLPDSREVSFNKLQGKTFPSLVVVARPHLRVADVNSDRAKLDAKVKTVLMYAPTKFTEWLIQQGLVKSEQKCSIHSATQLKLGMYSDVSKFPYSGGYVWISECCPQRFVSVFSGSIFEGSPHPPLVILKILYHWSCQTNIQNVTQWVKVDNLYVKGMYTWLRSICTVALQTHIRKLGGPQTKVEVGVISLGTTSQDGNSRQVKVEVLGILETSTKLIRLRAIEPLADGDRNYKKRFSKILEPLVQWVNPSSIIVTDLTVDKATLHQMGFSTVIQTTSVEAGNSNRTIMEYLRRIVPRMFQNTLSLLSRQIIQQFLDELVWREWFGTTSMQAFDHAISHLAEQTRHEASQSLIVRLNRVALNPFKSWGIAAATSTVVPPATPAITPKTTDASASKKRKRKEPEPQPKAAMSAPSELNRPHKSTSPDVPEQMVPLENYYYGTIDNYPPKTNVTLNLKCPFCKEVYNNNIVLMNHLFKHAHNVSQDGQMCRYCLTSVPTANDLLKHIATAHPSETKHDNGFVCLICETQYMNPFVLGKHMSKEHCPAELPYQCGTCGYKCSNHKQAIDHFYKQHDNGPTIQCPFCLKSTTVFSSSRNIAQNMHYFIQHLQKHQRKQYAKRCGKCNLWFVQKDVLKDHQTKMHASQRGKTGLVPWVAPRNGVMVPKSKMDKYPCDAEGINFTTLFYNVSKDLKCKECDGVMDSNKHFPSFESCQNPNCQYSTCCSNAMQEHNSKCNKLSQQTIPKEKLPCDMFCICGYSSQDGNQMAKHLAVCEKKSAYPSLFDAKSASVTHSMLDVLGLVRKPEETDKKPTPPSRTVKKSVAKAESVTITLDDDESMELPKVKSEKTKKAGQPDIGENKDKTAKPENVDDSTKSLDDETPKLKKPKLESSVAGKVKEMGKEENETSLEKAPDEAEKTNESENTSVDTPIIIEAIGKNDVEEIMDVDADQVATKSREEVDNKDDTVTNEKEKNNEVIMDADEISISAEVSDTTNVETEPSSEESRIRTEEDGDGKIQTESKVTPDTETKDKRDQETTESSEEVKNKSQEPSNETEIENLSNDIETSKEQDTQVLRKENDTLEDKDGVNKDISESQELETTEDENIESNKTLQFVSEALEGTGKSNNDDASREISADQLQSENLNDDASSEVIEDQQQGDTIDHICEKDEDASSEAVQSPLQDKTFDNISEKDENEEIEGELQGDSFEDIDEKDDVSRDQIKGQLLKGESVDNISEKDDDASRVEIGEQLQGENDDHTSRDKLEVQLQDEPLDNLSEKDDDDDASRDDIKGKLRGEKDDNASLDEIEGQSESKSFDNISEKDEIGGQLQGEKDDISDKDDDASRDDIGGQLQGESLDDISDKDDDASRDEIGGQLQCEKDDNASCDKIKGQVQGESFDDISDKDDDASRDDIEGQLQTEKDDNVSSDEIEGQLQKDDDNSRDYIDGQMHSKTFDGISEKDEDSSSEAPEGELPSKTDDASEKNDDKSIKLFGENIIEKDDITINKDIKGQLQGANFEDITEKDDNTIDDIDEDTLHDEIKNHHLTTLVEDVSEEDDNTSQEKIEMQGETIESRSEKDDDTLNDLLENAPQSERIENITEEDDGKNENQLQNEAFESINEKDDETSQENVINQLHSEQLENISEKDDEPSQFFDDTSDVSNLISSNADATNSEAPEDISSVLEESKETMLEAEKSSNKQEVAEPMEYEDISNSEVDTLTAMETD